jgi:hypothetical protein
MVAEDGLMSLYVSLTAFFVGVTGVGLLAGLLMPQLFMMFGT